MANEKVVGSMGYNGWATTVEDKAKEIIMAYRAVNADQSIIFKGSIISLGKTYQEANHDPDLFCTKVQDDLGRLLSYSFGDGVRVAADYTENDDGQYEVAITAEIRANGKSYDLGTVLKTNAEDFFSDYEQTYFDFKF